MKRKIKEQKNDDSKKKKTDEKPKMLTAQERERRKTSLYRAPTSEELSELRENENLYKNNLFRMQIQYLLEEVCHDEKKMKKVNTILHELNAFLMDIAPSEKSYEISDDIFPEDIVFPLPEVISRSRIKGKFQFISPKETKVIGSFLLKTMIKPNTSIDIAVEMPTEFFQGRDFLNYRYHYKRALYLTWLADSLRKWEHTDKIFFTCDSNVYKPILGIALKGKIGKKYSIRLHLSVPQDIFKYGRLSPLKNNVRSNWYEDIEDNAAEELEFPTPNYNSSILSDILYESHLHTLHNSLKECPGMKDAICLLKVWLKQRNFKGDCPFNGFLGSMFMAYLLASRVISPHMSSYQIFRLALNSLANSDWTKCGITMCQDDDCQSKVGDFHANFDVVFVDQTGHLNLCADVDKVTYEMIKHEAKISLGMLDDSRLDGFDALFIKRKYFLQSVDHCFRLTNLSDFKLKLSHSEQHKHTLIDNGGDWSLSVPKLVAEILCKGLDKRVHRISMKPKTRKEWSVDSVPPSFAEESFEFGLHLNTEFSDNVVIMGPPADQPEVCIFLFLFSKNSSSMKIKFKLDLEF